MKKKIILFSAIILIVCLSVIGFLYCNRDIIPEGGTYYVGVTTTRVGSCEGATSVYRSGQFFPKTPQIGDVYVYEWYEYRYNMIAISDHNPMFANPYSYSWKINEDLNGWIAFPIARAPDDRTRLEAINGMPVLGEVACLG